MADDMDLTWKLFRAAEVGDTDMARMMIAAGVNVNAQDYGGISALMYAVEHSHADIARELIAAEADVNAQDTDGRSALMYAFINVDWRKPNRTQEIVEMLINANVNVNAQDKDGKLLLYMQQADQHLKTL